MTKQVKIIDIRTSTAAQQTTGGFDDFLDTRQTKNSVKVLKQKGGCGDEGEEPCPPEGNASEDWKQPYLTRSLGQKFTEEELPHDTLHKIKDEETKDLIEKSKSDLKNLMNIKTIDESLFSEWGNKKIVEDEVDLDDNLDDDLDEVVPESMNSPPSLDDFDENPQRGGRRRRSSSDSDRTVDLISRDPLFLVLGQYLASEKSGKNIVTVLEKMNDNLERLLKIMDR